jgi:hypothetical protein
MPVIRDDEQERLARIEGLVKKLHEELSALREESRVVVEQMATNAVDNAKGRFASATAAKARATSRQQQTKTRTDKKRR